ncbi:MAG: ABC transporter ATP-binding protein [Gammaproteobacteria bacterium]|nr:ABC transporter ATP-binding protein [Gammaproteobacteria bacterium]
MNAISISNLEKVYPGEGEAYALKGIDLEVEEGDFFGLLGPNGAGKSTAIGIICSLVNKTAGKVLVFGQDIDATPVAVKASIGMVPQEFNFSVFEKVKHIVVNQAGYYGLERGLAYEHAEYYLKKLGLWEKRNVQARLLSGGMKRRLMIARALVHEPRLLILDEPTAGVDIELRRSMWDFLREINANGTTIILTTHYLEEAESLCRNLAIIDNGRIVQHTSMKDLIAQLDSETFVLDLARPIGILPEAPGCVLRKVDSQTLEVDVPKEQAINEIFTCLSDKGIEVLSMRNKTNRLEELFLDLVKTNNPKPSTTKAAHAH